MNLLRYLLWPLAFLYGSVMQIRNFLFARKILKSVEFEIPIISVGNLAVGGSGKTPMVKTLIGMLQNDYKIGILSRGYGRKTKGFLNVAEGGLAEQFGDEPLEIKNAYPSVEVAVCENRVLGISELIGSSPTLNLIILDDAFQHRYVKPKISLLLSKANKPFYKDLVMPAGRLREFWFNYKRADAIIFTDFNGQKLAGFNIPVFHSTLVYDELKPVYGQSELPTKCLAVSALANAQSFEYEVKKHVDTVKTISFKDHFNYYPSTVKRLEKMASEFDKNIVTTAKDWVKLKPLIDKINPDFSVFILPVKSEILEKETFRNWLIASLKN
ncbi:MAG: tetraacyldisaccharide 4'-kinase [Flavobacteriales bacterium]|nr:tetraacyldisaccharide 4'-kinase [Flavobacteriales bacterium]